MPDARLLEHVEDGALDFRPLVVQGAGRIVSAFGQTQQATLAEFGTVDGFDHFEEFDGIGRPRQLETAAAALEGVEEFVLGQVLEDFGEKVLGNLQFSGYVAAQHRVVAVFSQVDHGAEAVFAGLGYDHRTPRGYCPHIQRVLLKKVKNIFR